jgi:hypothetical protein
MRLIKGKDLNNKQRRHVLASFVYRWTFENERAVRAHYSRLKLSCPSMPLQTDAQYLAEHAFWFKNNGEPTDVIRYCEPEYVADNG